MRVDRRTFIQSLGLGSACLARNGFSQSTNKKPNIVLIMADDMGYSDIGCYGGEVHTPHLDSLAKGGVRFTQFYNTSRCCPTRASLLTGLYPHQAGVGHMSGNKGYPAYQGYLNENCQTIAEVLKPAGYHTLMTGKWHVGSKPGQWPCDRGFDKFYGSNTSTGSYFGLNEDQFDRRLLMNNKEIQPPDKWYATDAYTDYAIQFMKEARQQDTNPFFLYLAYTAPHWPLHALQDDIKKYRGKYKKGWQSVRENRYRRMKEMGIIERDWELSELSAVPWDSLNEKQKDRMDLKMAVYAAMIDRMDQNIGRVVQTLKEMGEYENTLILFLSDNGGCAEGGMLGFDRKDGKVGGPDSYSSYGLAWANASNTPFRKYKKYEHEGGIATPLIAHWPRQIAQPGSITHQAGHVIDIMATCCDVAGANYPKHKDEKKIHPLEGKSLLPILKGRQRKGHSTLCFEHQGNQAIRKGKWKLVRTHNEEWELFDLENDRTETNNLITKHPKKAKTMKKEYKNWMDRCGVLPWPFNKRKADLEVE